MSITTAPAPVTPPPAPQPERTVDETLCAAVYLQRGLAEYVLGMVHHGQPAAWAPSTSLDVRALVRHSTVVFRTRRLRDILLCLLVAVAVAVPAVQAGGFLGPVAGLVVAAALALFWGYRAYTQGRERPETRIPNVRWVIGLLVLAAAGVLVLVREPRLWITVGTVLGAIVAAWSMAVGELLWAQHRARAILTHAGPPGDLAPPLDDAVEERIARLKTANVVPYNAARAKFPFVGNGFRVRPWSVDVDVLRGATGDDGKEKVPEPVDIVEMHEFLSARFGGEIPSAANGARRVGTGHRLYVDGTRIPWGSDLLAGDPPLPRERMEWPELAERLQHPEHTDFQRVYFWVEEVGRHGEIAVALFVRPHLNGAHLSVEMVPHVVPPLKKDIEEVVAGLPTHSLDRLTLAVRAGTRLAPELAVRGPIECAREVWRVIRLRHWRRLWRRAARRRRPYDFGAVNSLREGVSVTSPKRLSHFVTSDLARINTYLQSRVLGCVKEYLDGLGVDTEPLDDSMKKTVNNIQNWNIGDVRGDMVGFGNGHTFGPSPKDDSGKDDE
ncbi:hypothetical protein ACTMTJ_22745 [Phytohabitans sp. LJ34]|uniref:hypothetical protein n=1 Tax=Phytohabitans sp. LJ34 TaxID=3452217 RepID=UPI003F8A17E6